MKKLFFLSMILTLSVGAYANQTVVISENNNSTLFVSVDKIIISVTWGHNGTHKDCEGHGICVVIEGDIPDMSKGTASVNSNGNLVLNIDLSTVSRQNSKLFDGNTFDMPESYVLDSQVCKALGIRDYTIRKGKYNMVKRGSSCTITF